MPENTEIFESELYISQVILYNEDLRKLVCDELGIPGYLKPNDILYECFGQDNLMKISRRLNTTDDKIFGEIRKSLEKKLGARSSIRPSELDKSEEGAKEKEYEQIDLKPEDIGIFLQDEYINKLAEILGCKEKSPSTVFLKLFKEEKINIYYEKLKYESSENISISDKFFKLINGKNASEKISKAMKRDISLWSFVKLITKKEAKEKLKEKLKCEQEYYIYEALINLMQKKAEPAKSNVVSFTKKNKQIDSGQTFDIIAIMTLKEIFKILGIKYIEKAKKSARKLIKFNKLLSLINFYYEKYYKEAIKSWFSQEQTIYSLTNADIIQKLNSNVKIDELQAEETNDSGIRVVYKENSSEDSEFKELFYLPTESTEIALHLKNNFPINCDDLSIYGDSSIDKVLFTYIPHFKSTESEIFKKLLEKNFPIVEYFILSGRKLPDPFKIFKTQEDKNENVLSLNIKNQDRSQEESLSNIKTLCKSPGEINNELKAKLKAKKEYGKIK